MSWIDRPLWHLTLPWGRPPLMANDTGKLRDGLRVKSQTRDQVALVARSLRLEPISTPVAALLWYFHGTLRTVDPDNIAPTLKRCLDGLRLAGVLADDSGRHVLLTAQRCVTRDRDPYAGARPRVVLSLYDASDFSLPHPAPSPSATLTAAPLA